MKKTILLTLALLACISFKRTQAQYCFSLLSVEEEIIPGLFFVRGEASPTRYGCDNNKIILERGIYTAVFEFKDKSSILSAWQSDPVGKNAEWERIKELYKEIAETKNTLSSYKKKNSIEYQTSYLELCKKNERAQTLLNQWNEDMYELMEGNIKLYISSKDSLLENFSISFEKSDGVISPTHIQLIGSAKNGQLHITFMLMMTKLPRILQELFSQARTKI